MISKKMPFDKLSSKDKITVLEWMIEGIHSALALVVRTKTHTQFLMSLNREEYVFSPDQVWNSFGESSQNHFDHAMETIDKIDKMIESELSPVKDIKKVQPPPAPPVPSTPTSKKTKPSKKKR